jgi:hypothetical protein
LYKIFLLGKNSFLHWLKTIFPSFCQTKICKKLAPKKITDHNTSQVVRGLQLITFPQNLSVCFTTLQTNCSNDFVTLHFVDENLIIVEGISILINRDGHVW